MTPRPNKMPAKYWLLLILLLAFLLRAGTAVWLGNKMEVLEAGGTHDQVSYDMLAYRLAQGYGFTFPQAWYPWVPADTPTSYYSGIMVLHLAVLYQIFGYNPLIPRLLYALLGTIIVLLIYRLGKKLFGERAALLAALLAAVYAYLILYSATLLTETPFILFLLLALDQAYQLLETPRPGTFLLLGVGLAGALLFRMAVLPFVAVLLIWLVLKLRQQQKRYPAWQILIPCGLMVVAVAPWTIRNYELYGRFMLLESQFGHVFWNGNHPDRPSDWGEVGWVAPIPADLADLNEADLTYELLSRGQQEVLAHPDRFLRLTLGRARVFFMFWPSASSSLMSNVGRVLSFGLFLPFMLAGLILSLKSWQKLLPIYLFLVIHLGVYLSSWVMIRYRVPADALLLLFAGLTFSLIVEWAPFKKRLLPPTSA